MTSSSNPGADAVLLEGAGHFAMLDRPEAFVEALLEWRRAGRPAGSPEGGWGGPARSRIRR